MLATDSSNFRSFQFFFILFHEVSDVKMVVSKNRQNWFSLILFAFYSGSNSFQWLQFTMIKPHVVKFYSDTFQATQNNMFSENKTSKTSSSNYSNSSNYSTFSNFSDPSPINNLKTHKNPSFLSVEYTAEIYYIGFIFMVFPATWLINKITLRQTVLLGSGFNFIGSLIKAIGFTSWHFIIIGQTIVALTQCLILPIPPKISFELFTEGTRNRTTSIGVFGNQVGVALGFLMPIIFFNNLGMAGLNYVVAGVTGVLFLLLVLFFDTDRQNFDKDDKITEKSNYSNPTSPQIQLETNHSIPDLMKNPDYIFLLISYGILVGAYYTFSVLLPIYFPESCLEFVGQLGFVMILAGLVGSIVCGYILDKVRGDSPEHDLITSPYKKVTVIFYFCASVFLVWFFLQVDGYFEVDEVSKWKKGITERLTILIC